MKDKVALVTGVGPGLGKAIAVTLAREGAKLVICDIDEAALVPNRPVDTVRRNTYYAYMQTPVPRDSVATPDFNAYLDQIGEAGRNRLWQGVPAGRFGTVDEYAATVLHLASNEHYLVGQVISPNGGTVM